MLPAMHEIENIVAIPRFALTSTPWCFAGFEKCSKKAQRFLSKALCAKVSCFVHVLFFQLLADALEPDVT